MDSADALADSDDSPCPHSVEPGLQTGEEEGTIKNDQPPIIGILSQELSVSIKERFPEYKSFIAASYVKSVEAAGARVVPILIGQDDNYYSYIYVRNLHSKMEVMNPKPQYFLTHICEINEYGNKAPKSDLYGCQNKLDYIFLEEQKTLCDCYNEEKLIGGNVNGDPKWVPRSNGCRVQQVKQVNGVLYPGGACYFNVSGGFAEAGEKVYNLALEANTAGDYFPLFGVCLGFELLLHLSNNKQELRTECDALNIGLPIIFKPNFSNSKLFKDVHKDVIKILNTEPVTSNHHRWCITEANITKQGLDKQWDVLSLGKDKNQLEFISSIEMKNYPIAGVQFHPEKNAYEWKESQNNPHSFKAIYSQRYFYDWFVNQARRNSHTFPSKENELEALINNYPPVFTGKNNMYYEQIYLFK